MSNPSARGPKGETLFHEFWPWHLTDSDGAELLRRAGEALSHIKGPAPDRLLALLGALVTEDAVNYVLQAFMPGFKALNEQRDFTFAIRVGTLQALRFVPIHICADADHIRNVRNRFAHDLSREGFAQIESKLVRSTADRLRRMKLPVSKSAAVNFQHLVVHTAAALYAYGDHVRHLRQYMASDAFHVALAAWVRPRFKPDPPAP